MTRLVVDKPGLYTMSAADYHADPCPEPSLSSSIARELLANSPKHAWWKHPRLNPAYEPEHKQVFDLGQAAHALLLEGESGCVIIEAKDYKTQAARDQRDAAYAAYKVPLLAHRWQDVQDMVDAARRQLEKHEAKPTPFTDGKPEQTLVWEEDGVWCRARLDWLHTDRRLIGDYKSTGVTANPDVWARRTLYGSGYDVQDSFYTRGIKKLFGIDAGFYFVPQETFRPFALSVVALEPEPMDLADAKVTHAIGIWRECLKTGRFPGYPLKTCWAALPPWEETQWLERQARDSWARGLEDDGRPIEAQLNRD